MADGLRLVKAAPRDLLDLKSLAWPILQLRSTTEPGRRRHRPPCGTAYSLKTGTCCTTKPLRRWDSAVCQCSVIASPT